MNNPADNRDEPSITRKQGRLCYRGHDDGTGHSIRNSSNDCITCVYLRFESWRKNNSEKTKAYQKVYHKEYKARTAKPKDNE